MGSMTTISALITTRHETREVMQSMIDEMDYQQGNDKRDGIKGRLMDDDSKV